MLVDLLCSIFEIDLNEEIRKWNYGNERKRKDERMKKI
jgi:hypothetical protein